MIGLNSTAQKYVKYFIILIFFSFFLRIATTNSVETGFLNHIKAFLAPLVNWYLLAFQDPNTSLLLFLIILFLCIFCLCWVYFKCYISTSRILNLSIEKVKVLEQALESKEVGSSLALTELEKDKLLQKTVLKFRKSSLSADDFPSLSMLETRGFPLKIISALPGYFVGIGLVTTFLGLVAALYFAAQGMKSGNYEDARLSLMHLLSAASFKFTTSIAGVASSLCLSFLYKFLLHNLDLKINILNTHVMNIFNLMDHQ